MYVGRPDKCNTEEYLKTEESNEDTVNSLKRALVAVLTFVGTRLWAEVV